MLVALAVAGCGAGQDVQTEVEPAVNGSFAQVGPIAIRDAQLAYPSGGIYPSGGTATLTLTIVNTGPSDDELLEVSSPVAASAQITGDRNLPGFRALQVGMPGRPAAPPSTPSLTSTARPASSSPSPTSGSARPTAGGLRSQDVGKATIVLNGLSEPLYSGKTYAVTLTFRNAGTVIIELPIAAPTTARVEPTSGRPTG